MTVPTLGLTDLGSGSRLRPSPLSSKPPHAVSGGRGCWQGRLGLRRRLDSGSRALRSAGSSGTEAPSKAPKS